MNSKVLDNAYESYIKNALSIFAITVIMISMQ